MPFRIRMGLPEMEARRFEEMDGAALKPFRGGWCLGREEFKQKMIELMAGKLGENQSQMRTNSNLSQLQP